MKKHHAALKNVLFVIDGLEFGGGERGFSQIINRLSQEKYSISIASCRNNEFERSINNGRIKFFHLPFSKILNISLIIQLLKILRENEIDIVHGQGARAEFYARLAKRLSNRSKYVSTIQMPVEGFNVNPLKKSVYTISDRMTERFVDKFIVPSEDLKKMIIRQHKILPEKIEKIYNGVELDSFIPQKYDNIRDKIRREYGVENNDLLIGSIGRLVWQKGFEYLIMALPAILDSYKKTKIVLVGEGTLEMKLRQLSDKLNIKEQIIFSGFKSDIKKILSAIDILVIPSILEGFPMITLEGMAMGKPIIASNINGLNEQIIDGQTGLLIDPHNPAAIGNAVIKLIKDKPLFKNIGDQARKIVERQFSIDNMIMKTEQVYNALC